MAESIRYFQLTPDILLEYNYSTTKVIKEQEKSPDGYDNIGKLSNICSIDNSYDNCKYLFIDNDDVASNVVTKDNFVLPYSKIAAKFLKFFKTDRHFDDGENLVFKRNDIESTSLSNSFVFDKMRFHFTSRNFIGEYDALIFDIYINKSNKRRVSLLSFVMPRTMDLRMNGNPLLINQKLYTSYIDKKIISTDVLIDDGVITNIDNDNKNKGAVFCYKTLRDFLLDNNERFMVNTPIIIDIYGVNTSYENSGYEIYKTVKINSVTIPCKDKYDNISVNIEESNDGDYYELGVITNNGGSFTDFIRNIDEDVSNYVILHELSLIEYLFNNTSEITHREHYIINAITENEKGENVINKDLNEKFLYRPICKYGDKCVRFIIKDIMRIVNTTNNTTIVKSCSITQDKPYKYGKYMNKIYMGEIPMSVNVYNKRRNIQDEDIDGDSIKFSTANRSYTFEGSNGSVLDSGILKRISINALCETTNIRISIKE